MSDFALTDPALVTVWLYEAFMGGMWCPILGFLAFLFYKLADGENNNN